jgi:hypothetical protein
MACTTAKPSDLPTASSDRPYLAAPWSAVNLDIVLKYLIRHLPRNLSQLVDSFWNAQGSRISDTSEACRQPVLRGAKFGVLGGVMRMLHGAGSELWVRRGWV